MGTAEKAIQNLSKSRPRIPTAIGNTPDQYKDRGKQYLADRRRLFDDRRAYLATDYVHARVQGITDDFFEWVDTDIRLSDVSTQSVTAFDAKLYDNFKEVLFKDLSIDYIPAGALLETMGSIWMIVNPANMSTASRKAVATRCRAHYNSYDHYGNIVSEPLIIDRATMLANRNESPDNLVLAEGYFNVKCQKNANTEKLDDNQRIILGKKAYVITGMTDFFEEFTYDTDSAHILTFTVRKEEPTERDDLENRIADGYSYRFGAKISGAEKLKVGMKTALTAEFTLNGDSVPPTDEFPQTWRWSTSDENAFTVDDSGVVEAVGGDRAIITAVLSENPSISAQFEISVQETDMHVAFTSHVSPEITAYTTEEYSAAYFEDGIETDEPLEWEFSGANRTKYKAEVQPGGKKCRITCYGSDDVFLTITVSHGNTMAQTMISLEGY